MKYLKSKLEQFNITKNSVIGLFEKNIKKLKIIKKLNGGVSNDLFLINDTYVWRVFSNRLIDHKYEVKIMEKLDYFSIFYKDKKNICYKFIDGHKKENASYNLCLEAVLKEVRNIHKIKVKTPHIWHSLIPDWMGLISDKKLKGLLKKKYKRINKKLTQLDVQNDSVFCHNDIIAGNVLFNKKKCFVIDWEFAGVNYYFSELGNIICEHHMDYEREAYNLDAIDIDLIKKVLRYYNGKAKIADKKIAKIELGINMSHFIWALYAFVKMENSVVSNFNYAKLAQARINQLNKNNI